MLYTEIRPAYSTSEDPEIAQFIPDLEASIRAQELHRQLRELRAERDALPDPYTWRVSKTGNVVSGRYTVQIHQRAAPLDSKGEARSKAHGWLREQRERHDDRKDEIARQIVAIGSDPDIHARTPGSYTAAEIADIINRAQADIPQPAWVSVEAACIASQWAVPGASANAEGNTITFSLPE